MVTGDEIKAARTVAGESQEAFGARFGVDQSTIHRWESDGPPARGPARMAIEKVLADMGHVEQPAPEAHEAQAS